MGSEVDARETKTASGDPRNALLGVLLGGLIGAGDAFEEPSLELMPSVPVFCSTVRVSSFEKPLWKMTALSSSQLVDQIPGL